MSLLQDVLRTQLIYSLDKALASGRNSPDDSCQCGKCSVRFDALQGFCSGGLLPTTPYLDVSPGQSGQVQTRLAASIPPSLAHWFRA